jgi:hypothetical protein
VSCYPLRQVPPESEEVHLLRTAKSCEPEGAQDLTVWPGLRRRSWCSQTTYVKTMIANTTLCELWTMIPIQALR